jgi:uroporphyrinogen-III decarboxylase
MQRQLYLNWARQGLRLPIGTHLVLHEKADHETILNRGEQLGAVLLEAARRYKSPLAIPLMDLTLEKEALLALLGVPSAERERFHFNGLPEAGAVEKIKTAPFLTPRMQATCDAIRYVTEHQKQEDLVALGMGIGPFSLMTKLLRDPIIPVYMAGSGLTGADDEDVALVECVLELSMQMILRYLTEQVRAGAQAIFLCEPAANLVFFSPNQLAEGSDVFERFVLAPNLKIKARLDELGADLIFHDCGELTDGMVESFNRLRPVMLSLGCSRTLWKDAALISKDIVLYGNLPSKKFYSDEAVSVAEVERMTRELLVNMGATGHPFILGTECDVLSVPGREETLRRKVDAMMVASV